MEKRLNVRVSEAAYRALTEKAQAREIPVAQIIREALRLYLWPAKKAA
jgi:predicted HicB family RNase H-like nuclease